MPVDLNANLCYSLAVRTTMEVRTMKEKHTSKRQNENSKKASVINILFYVIIGGLTAFTLLVVSLIVLIIISRTVYQ